MVRYHVCRVSVSNAQHTFLDNCGKGCGSHIIKYVQYVKQCIRMAWMVRHKHSNKKKEIREKKKEKKKKKKHEKKKKKKKKQRDKKTKKKKNKNKKKRRKRDLKGVPIQTAQKKKRNVRRYREAIQAKKIRF